MSAPRLQTADDGGLSVEWDDQRSVFSAALLRARCRCAFCRSAGLKGLLSAVPADIAVVGLATMGYGVQLQFSDGHQRGIYPWAYLRELALSG